jgi:chaperonin cofactor prefoldin
MEDTSEFNEVSQLRTRCTILESQIQVLEKQNADLKSTITILHPDRVSSTDKNMKSSWRDVEKVGKFPIKDDGDFQI